MIVYDASTLILLSKAELLRLALQERKGCVTQEVWREIQKGKETEKREFAYFKELGLLNMVKNPVTEKVERLCHDFNLGLGEATSLWFAKEKNKILATDDRLAIRACKILSVAFMTAIHFLIYFKKAGKLSVERIWATLEQLQKYGRYSESILMNVRNQLKENKL